MDIAHIILYVAGVVLVFILILAIREYYATLRRRRWLEEYSVGATGKTTGGDYEIKHPLPPPKKSNISPEAKQPEPITNPKFCRLCNSYFCIPEKFYEHHNPKTELRTNQQICRICGSPNIHSIDKRWGDYSFCSNDNCSNNHN